MNCLKICAVVLNFKAYDETIACVKSLLKQSYKNFEIVIIENGSNNGSLEILTEEFKSNPLVHIIPSDKNLGFAKGNNLGIEFCRNNLDADFVFVTNSDIVVPNSLFHKVADLDCNGIGVVSPTVHKLDGSYQMPNENTDNVEKRIKVLASHLLIAKIRRIFKKNKAGGVKRTAKVIPPDSWNKYVIQGCSYFLTPSFFKKYNKLYPKTFLYWEEIDLLYYLYKAGLGSILIETEPLIHKDKGSTSFVAANLNDFQLKESFKSMLRSLPLFVKDYKGIKKHYD